MCYIYFKLDKKKNKTMSSKFFGNSKAKSQSNNNQKNKTKSRSKGKATIAVRKTGRGG